MLLGTGHDHSADWWALGVLIYEMLTGVPPFYHKNRNMMFLNIEQAKVKWPDQAKHGISITSTAKDLILKLLKKEKNQRLGHAGGSTEVLQHPFFDEINTQELLEKKTKAPFIPEKKDLE